MDNLDNELIWKDIIGFEGYYQINKYGVIKSLAGTQDMWCNGKRLRKKTERILEPTSFAHGYPYITLYKGGRHTLKGFRLHRLVAIHFVPNPHNYPFVDHINAIRSDCFYKNLRWCTAKMNIQYTKENGRERKAHGEKHVSAKLSESDVAEIKRLHATGNYTHRGLGKMFNINNSSVFKVLHNISWKHLKSA